MLVCCRFDASSDFTTASFLHFVIMISSIKKVLQEGDRNKKLFIKRSFHKIKVVLKIWLQVVVVVVVVVGFISV